MKSFPVHITSGRILLLKNSEPDIKRLQLRCFEFAGFTWISSKKGFTLLGSFYLTTAFVAFLNKLNKPWKHPFVKVVVPWLALEIMVQIKVVCQVITFRRCPVTALPNIITGMETQLWFSLAKVEFPNFIVFFKWFMNGHLFSLASL